MPDTALTSPARAPRRRRYVLEENVGFILRQVTQRHVGLFMDQMPDGLTPTQFSALAKLRELGPTAQTQLGRDTAMDAATIKGVVDRLVRRGLVRTERAPLDARLLIASLTDAGRILAERSVEAAARITRDTLLPLSPDEQHTLLDLLRRLR